MRALILASFLALSPALALADDVETGCDGIAIEDCARDAGEIGHEPPPADFDAAAAAGFGELVMRPAGEKPETTPALALVAKLHRDLKIGPAPFGVDAVVTSLGTDRTFLIAEVKGVDFEPKCDARRIGCFTGIRLFAWVLDRGRWLLLLDAGTMGTVWKCGRLGVVQPTGFSEWAWNGAIFVNMGRPWSTKFPGE